MANLWLPWFIYGFICSKTMVKFGIVAPNAVSGLSETESVERTKRIAHLPHIISKNRTIFKLVFITLKLT